MCAPAGAGKSFHAEKLSQGNDAIILSSDALRGVIGKNDSDLEVSSQVFRTMETMTEYFLKRGESVIIDATNYHMKARKPFIDIAKKLSVKVVAYVIDRPLDVILTQNRNRERFVPEHVIEKMFNNFVKPVVGEVNEVIHV